MAQATAYEQLMLELINRARLDPAAEAARLGISLNQGLSSGSIDTSSKTPLAMNSLLIDSARAHSLWMLATDTFSHTGAAGSTSRERMQKAGYSFEGDWRSGENLAWGGRSEGLDVNAMVKTLHDSLFRSASHRFNTLYEKFSEVGVGQLTGTFNGMNTAMVSQNFARSGTNIFITGVAYEDRDKDAFYSLGEADAAVKVTFGGRNTYTGLAGGYQMAACNGEQAVTFDDGAGLARVRVTLTGENAKLDYVNSDTILSSASLTLVSGVNKATLLGLDNLSLDGSTANDVLRGNKGNNAIFGDAGADSLDGGAGNDRLKGGDGSDKLYGGADRDVLYGQNGNDWLFGEQGNDTLSGGAGADRLVGGAGADRLYGGAHADLFIFTSLADSSVSSAGRDMIHDFSQADCDRLDVSQIDANTRISGDQTFKFIGENANFNGSAGELRFQHVHGDTIVYGDVNGDRVADFSFALNDDIVLRASDFVL